MYVISGPLAPYWLPAQPRAAYVPAAGPPADQKGGSWKVISEQSVAVRAKPLGPDAGSGNVSGLVYVLTFTNIDRPT